MSTTALTEKEINEALEELEGWEFEDNAITVSYQFASFRDAVSFIVRISFEAEDLGHHPEIYNVYNNVEIRLTTHDADGQVTRKDLELAKRIDNLEM
ncbi:MAG: 4a-hydroxytetrahydrobiopterin dehydratase [Candidatus Cyclonatronum sp.]|uniref:4a-hydroxytetrahydrobiopterin dehydratase n=1 Tax=Cyclonatronum sp. TaxID=3024185 RepID=UPI0025B8DF72|nr:4a-hydroxytetrahydrobiopterin dehydratase [Cyclonatronum sp.]MCC5933217.1 4a-hydroxytetrahydrobiopterin dehydratase [Balneolales bacterium]MCH8485883.1 4a-hydroxytetrahydrobiopterin dehydratase [Cyclonatronum sp.]